MRDRKIIDVASNTAEPEKGSNQLSGSIQCSSLFHHVHQSTERLKLNIAAQTLIKRISRHLRTLRSKHSNYPSRMERGYWCQQGLVLG